MNYSDEIIAIIPARSGSVGVKDKNIRDLAGHPLMAYSIMAAKAINDISRVFVSTDSKEYAKVSEKYGAVVPFLRPAEISGSNAKDIQYLQQMLLGIYEKEKTMPGTVVLLRPTSPLRDVDKICQAIQFMNKSEASAVISVIENQECPYKWVKMVNGELQPLFDNMKIDDINNPRQSFDKTYYPDGNFEILRSENIVENNQMYGQRVVPVIVEKTVDIDTESDFEEAEKIISQMSMIGLSL